MLGVMIAISGCTRSGDPPPAATGAAEIAQIPYNNSTGFLYGDRLRVPRAVPVTWNGVPIDAWIMTDYLNKESALPRTAEPLYVEFEPGTPPARAAWVRRQIVERGLCRQNRCREVGWNVPRPVVN
jgi:hypothetical protein